MALSLYPPYACLMADPKAIPQRPSRAEIDKVFKLASESLLLAGTMTTARSSGQPSGTMRSNIRGVEIKAHPIPVHDPSRYTHKQINQINRRVKFAIDNDVSYSGECPQSRYGG